MNNPRSRTIEEAPKPAKGWHIVALFIFIVVAGGGFLAYFS